MEQLILLPERLVLLVHMCLRYLEGHIFISDLGDFRDEEHGSENEDEDADGEIHPLDTL